MRWPARSKQASGTMRISGATSARLRLGLADAPLPARELIAERIGAHDQRLAAPGDRRQRQLRAGLGELAHQRQRIDLALHRHEAGDDDAGRDGKGKCTRGDLLGRRRAHFRRQRVALGQRCGADFNFRSWLGGQASFVMARPVGTSHSEPPRKVDGRSCCDVTKLEISAEPQRPSERDPGTLHK